MKKTHQRHFLKEKETKGIFLEISRMFGINIEKILGSKIRVEIDEIKIADLIIFNGKPLLARSNGQLFPTLSYEIFFPFLPKIVIDMGAIPYICKGADVMVPGIISKVGKFKENDILFVTDERHNKPLAIGLALYNFEETEPMKHGKILKNLHYIGDTLWNYLKRY